MLAISLEPEEYITIGDDIVVKFSKAARGRCFLAVEADRSIPIVRGAVRERNGTPPPACITTHAPRKKPAPRPEPLLRWNGDRERAARAMEQLADLLEERGEKAEAQALRGQLARLVPAPGEGEEAPR